MIPPKYRFSVGKRVRYIYLTENRGIGASGEFLTVAGRVSSPKMQLNSKRSIVIDVISTATYNAVFFYGASGEFISSTPLINKANITITPPTGAASYAVTFAANDISGKYTPGEEIDFVYLAQTINPHYKELSKKLAKENNQEFFRASLDGKITLFGYDYEFIYSSDIEDQFMLLIDKYMPKTEDAPSEWANYFRGEFSKTDCKFDYERKKCELAVSPKDKYAEVINKYENTYDLVKLAPQISKINLHKRSLMQVYVLGANSISNFFGGTYWEDEVSEAIDSHDTLVNTYHFACVAIANEITISGLSEDIDGTYAGVNGQLSNGKGYSCTITQLSGAETRNYGTFSITRDSDGQRVAGSSTIIVYASPYIYMPTPSVEFIVTAGDKQITVTPDKVFAHHIYRRLLADIDTISTDDGTKTLYDLPTNDFVSDNRNFKKCIGFVGDTVYCTSKTTTTPTRYGVNDKGEYFTNQFLPLSLGSARPLPICRSAWVNASLWFAYDSYYEIWEPRLRKSYTLKDSYSVADVIKVLLSQIDPSLKHEATAEYSQFLYGKANPIGPDRFYVYLAQKTNVLKGDYDQPAQKAEVKLAEIMNMLRDCFRCYWFIENGKFRIEHIWFFINGGTYSASPRTQLDFTNLIDQFNKKSSVYFQSEVEYDKSELSQRYEFNWMDDATELFGGVTLDVLSNYVQKDKTEEITANQFSSDVDYMLFNPEAFSDDGFALLCPIKNGDNYELPIVTARLLDENRTAYTAIVQNWFASWAYLTSTFYMRDMPARMVRSNVAPDMLATPKMSMTHSIEFPAEGDIDEFQLIKTSLGGGKVEEYSVDLNTGQTKVKLMYQPK